MKNERILNALERADDRYVEEAAPVKAVKTSGIEENAVRAEPVAVNAPKRRIYGGRIAAAACACVAVGGLVVWGAVGGVGNLTENPATADTRDMEEYAQTGSPESNGYHNFTMTREELYNCAWSCFIPTYFPAGYYLPEDDVRCVEANGLVPTYSDLDISIWLSNGIDDPDAKGYNPIYFGLTIGEGGIVESSPVYELQTLTVSDIAEMGKGGLISCAHDVRIQIGCPYPELVSDEEMYNMIMSMPYARQYQNDPEDKTGYSVAYLTAAQIRSGEGMPDYIPTRLPAGYSIVGLSPHYTFNGPDNHGNTLSLYISNGVDDPDSTNYNPIKYTVMITPEDSALDTENKPLYQNIWTLTLDDVKAAMESGGFYVVYMGNEVTEVSFPYPDRVSAKEIYDMVMSAPCAVDPNAEDVGYHTVYLSRQELYTNQWTMFIPRYMPENYRLAENTRFDVDEWGQGTIYAEFTDGNNPISYTIYIDPLKYPDLGSDSALVMRDNDITVGDMPTLKENGWIDSGNSVVKVKVDIEKPDLISDEELYRFVMSAPFADNFAASRIETADLSDIIDSNYLPVVDFDRYYNVERYTVDGGVFDGGIVGFDGTYVYSHNWDHIDDDTTYYSIVWYNVKTGETGILSDEGGKENQLMYLYADGEYVYCHKTAYDDLSQSVVRFNVKSGKEETVIEVGKGMIADITAHDGSMFIFVHYDTQAKLIRYDLTSGTTGARAESAEELDALPAAFAHIDTDMDSYTVMLPYKGGVIYVMPGIVTPDFIAPSCYLYYWDGKDAAIPLFEARLDSIYDGENGERLCFSDGETVYFIYDTYVNGTNAADGMQDTLCAYDLADAFTSFDFPAEHILAFNKNPTNSPYHEWHGTVSNCGDGMAAIDPYSGLIYDAENGWFTYVNRSVYYRTVKNGSSFDGMVMLEYADVEYDANKDFVDYSEEGKDRTLCIITRK